uniref:T-box domain-containing protein n=1 Tax=Trichogramma kaykai TaxID=54128 RepID=A0ABD2WJ32_9HYME
MSECQIKQCKGKGKAKAKDELKKDPPHVHLKPIIHHSDFTSTNYYRPDLEVLHQFGTFQSGLKIKVMNKKDWRSFLPFGTEMILTKSGRTMFPPIRVQLQGLFPDKLYMIVLEFKLVDYVRYKYNKEKEIWVAGKPFSQEVQPPVNSRLIAYHPMQGSKLMDHELNFKQIKFSNDKPGEQMVSLRSMHKYCPRLWIIECDNHINVQHSIQTLLRLYPSFSRDLEYSEFIATTAYQNQEVTKLKIEKNPFAAGFTLTGKANTKRKREEAKLREKQRLANISEQTDDENSAQESKSCTRKALIDDDNNSPSDECNCPKPRQMNDDWYCLIHENQPTRRTSTSSDPSNSSTFHRPWEAHPRPGCLSPSPWPPALHVSADVCESSPQVQHSVHQQNPQITPFKFDSLIEQSALTPFPTMPTFVHQAHAGFVPIYPNIDMPTLPTNPPMHNLPRQMHYGSLLPMGSIYSHQFLYGPTFSPEPVSKYQTPFDAFPLTPPDTPKSDYFESTHLSLAGSRPNGCHATLKRRNSQPCEIVNNTRIKGICVDEEQSSSPTSTCKYPRKRWQSDSMIQV